MGVTLEQQSVEEDGTTAWEPIAFASRGLTVAETKYSPIERETLAVKWGIQQFSHYLEPRKFTVYTDHRPIKFLVERAKKDGKKLSSRLTRWIWFFQGYDFEVKYLKGKANVVADALSRAVVREADEEERKARKESETTESQSEDLLGLEESKVVEEILLLENQEDKWIRRWNIKEEQDHSDEVVALKQWVRTGELPEEWSKKEVELGPEDERRTVQDG